MNLRAIGAVIVFFALSQAMFAERAVEGKNVITVRGQQQDIYFYPAQGNSSGKRNVLFLPGDGGWHGFAVEIARNLASVGYNVYGMDTRRYLQGFTTRTGTLKATDVTSDLRQIANWISDGDNNPVTLVGWSEGAGLSLLAASAEENRRYFTGLVAIGMPERNILGWRWVDLAAAVAKRVPAEPTFASIDFLPKLSPLPLVLIQSTRDEYVPVEVSKKLFAVAQEPKKFHLIEAQNHHFDGNAEQFFRALNEGVMWVAQSAK